MRVERAPGAFWDVVDGRTVVCAPGSGELYRLNPTGAFLWEMCNGQAVDSLAEQLRAVFPGEEREVLSADTRRFVSICATRAFS